jgi:serine phosphatase RsbU (regulator of sigma subunit)
LGTLQEVLEAERTGEQIFATLTSLELLPDRRSVRVMRAGHPGMLLRAGAGVEWVEVPGGPALGVLPDGMARWPVNEVTLPEGAGLVLFTDGLFEGRTGPGNERLGEEGLLELARSAAALPPEGFVDRLVGSAEALAEDYGGLADDVAVVHLQWNQAT